MGFSFSRKLLPVKAVYFFYLAGLSCLMPFLSLFLHSKGLTECQLGLIRGLEPIVNVALAPLWGCITDWSGNHKVVLIIAMSSTSLMTFSTLFVPKWDSNGTAEEDLLLNCSTKNYSFSENLCFNFSDSNPIPLRDVQVLPTSYFQTNSCQFQLYNSTYEQLYPLCNIHSCYNLSDDSVLQNFPHEQSRQYSCGRLYCSVWPETERTCNFCCCDASCSIIKIPIRSLENQPENGRIGASAFAISGNYLTFLLLLGLFLFASAFRCSVFPNLDSCTMELLDGNANSYRWQRLFGSIGWGIFALISGFTIDRYGELTGDSGYAPSFFLFISFMVAAITSVSFIVFPPAIPSKMLTYQLSQVLFKYEIISFLGVTLAMGMCFGIIQTFLFLFLEDLGGPHILMGLTLTITCISEIPFLYFAGPIARFLGFNGVICLTFVCFCVRFVAYACLENPWYVLPFELLHGITYGASWSTCSSYANQIAPPGLASTLQVIFSSVYMGLGKGMGTIVGGILYQFIGPRNLFLSSAMFCLLTAILYFLSLIACKRKGNKYQRFVGLSVESEGDHAVQMQCREQESENTALATENHSPPSLIQALRSSMRLDLTNINQPCDSPIHFPLVLDPDACLAGESTPPEIGVGRLEFHPPSVFRSNILMEEDFDSVSSLNQNECSPKLRRGSDSVQKRDREVRLDAIGSENSFEVQEGRRKNTLTSIV